MDKWRHFSFSSELNMCDIHICIWISQYSFSCGPKCGSFLPVKYLNFEVKLPIWTGYHTVWKVSKYGVISGSILWIPKVQIIFACCITNTLAKEVSCFLEQAPWVLNPKLTQGDWGERTLIQGGQLVLKLIEKTIRAFQKQQGS